MPAFLAPKKPPGNNHIERGSRLFAKQSFEVAGTAFLMISVHLLRLAAAGLATALLFTPAHAFDGTQTPADDPSPVEAFKSGTKAYKAGDIAGASRALEFAAGKGHAMAQWKLARMYSEGDGVPRDDYRAFEYYQAIVNAHADENPGTTQAAFVSSAMVALGSYYLNGIPNSSVVANPDRAIQLFEYAGTYFGDSDAQYNLGRIFLDGGAEHPRDPVLAARWLRLAATKSHPQAQAVLGHLLFAGADLPRQPARGLMYLTLARDAASGQADKWILDLYEQAQAASTAAEREASEELLEKFRKKRT
jgi:TPR repeat protein